MERIAAHVFEMEMLLKRQICFDESIHNYGYDYGVGTESNRFYVELKGIGPESKDVHFLPNEIEFAEQNRERHVVALVRMIDGKAFIYYLKNCPLARTVSVEELLSKSEEVVWPSPK